MWCIKGTEGRLANIAHQNCIWDEGGCRDTSQDVTRAVQVEVIVSWIRRVVTKPREKAGSRDIQEKIGVTPKPCRAVLVEF